MVAESFSTLDTDGDGHVSKVEYLDYALGSLDDMERTEKLVRVSMLDYLSRLFDASDINGDEFLQEGEVEYATFLSLLPARCRGGGDCDDELNFDTERSARRLASLDTNGDGEVSRSEFDTAAREQMVRWGLDEDLSFTEDVKAFVSGVFYSADLQRDNVLSARELQLAAFLIGDYAPWEIIDRMLRDTDTNMDLRLSAREVAAARAERVAKHGPGRSIIEQFADRFAAADTDGNGFLDVEEVNVLSSVIQSGLFNEF